MDFHAPGNNAKRKQAVPDCAKQNKRVRAEQKKTEKEVVWRSLVEYVIACDGHASLLDAWEIKSEKSGASARW